MPRVVGTDSATKRILHNPYQDAAWQALAARTPAGGRRFRTLTMFAGRRGGKTLAGGKATVQEAQTPGAIIYVAAPTDGKLFDFVWPAVWEFIPRAWVENWNEQRSELRLINQTIIRELLQDSGFTVDVAGDGSSRRDGGSGSHPFYF